MDFPILNDSTICDEDEKAEAKQVTLADYQVLYIGNYQDTINVQRFSGFTPPPPSFDSSYSNDKIYLESYHNPLSKYYDLTWD